MRAPGQAGLALVSVLVVSAALGVLAATAFLAVFLDAQAGANGIAADEAFDAAEAGLERLRSAIPPAPDLAAPRAWAGGTPPFGETVDFPSAPRAYRVRVRPSGAGGLEVESTGTAPRGARRRLLATLARESAFRPEAPLLLAAGTTVVAGGALAVDAGTGPRGAADDLSGARALASAVGGRTLHLRLGSGLGPALEPLRAATGTTVEGPLGAVELGTPAAPRVTRLRSSGEIVGAVRVTGILLADAPLRVVGSVDVDGLLLAAAGLEVSGSARVTGTLWVAERLEIRAGGSLHVADSAAARTRAAALAPGLLPRPLVLSGPREVW